MAKYTLTLHDTYGNIKVMRFDNLTNQKIALLGYIGDPEKWHTATTHTGTKWTGTVTLDA